MKVEGLIDLAKAWPGHRVGTLSTAKDDFRRAYESPTLLLMGNETRGLSQSLVGGMQYPCENSDEARS